MASTAPRTAAAAKALPQQRPPEGEGSRLIRARRRVPRWLGTFFAVIGLLCALAGLISPLRHGSRPILSAIDVWIVPAPPNLAYAVFLLLLAGAVSARKRAAWWILTGYWMLLLVADILIFPYIPLWDGLTSVVLAAFFLGLVIWARPEFYARVRRGAFWRALIELLIGLAAAVLIGWGLVALFHGTLKDPALLFAANRVLGGLVGGNAFTGHPPSFVSFLLGLLGALALLNAAAALFRSQRGQAGLREEDEARIRLLLARYGDGDSLGYFATRRDKNVVFADNGRACVTYRVEAGVCLASGDPIGDRESWGRAIDAWLNLARGYAWLPAAMGASEAGATAYAASGLGALHLGDEAILHLASFDLDGRDMRMTRQAVNRLRRSGATSRIRRHSALDEQEMAQVLADTDSWRDTEEERGFSMALGRLGDPSDGNCLLVEALDRDGQRIALLSFVPWGPDGVSLDVMRRDPAAPNGVMEFMAAELAAHGRAQGIRKVSLNFAVFRAVFEEGARIGAGPVLRVWRKLLLFLSKWWQLESLYRSNAKYHPEWYPRFLCYSEPRLLARIGLASGIAEGFVGLPWDNHRLKRNGRPKGVLPPVSNVGLPPLTEEELALANGAATGSSGAGLADGAQDLTGLPEQVRVRHRKLDRLITEGIEPYPADAERSTTLAAITARHPELPAGARTGEQQTVTGRLMLLRDHGGVVFARLRDWSGDLQLMLTREESGEELLRSFTADLDLGDQIQVTGEIGGSNRGELSLVVRSWRLISKCLRPLPDKRHGLTDPEAKVRQRYLDLVVNEESRTMLRTRGAVVQALRSGLLDRGYLEVETPILQAVHGGANARPFITHINAYDLDLYLRIAPELYLKRLCVGGVEKVFELGRVFRNEGVDYSHNPEFTVLEAYQALGDYMVMLDLTRELIQSAAVAAFGRAVVHQPGPDGKPVEYDISGQWPVKTVHGAISEALGEKVDADTGLEELRRLCERAEVPYLPQHGVGDLVQELYDHLVEAKTVLPTFYKDFPTEVSPLTRGHRKDPRLAERWDLVAFGTELGTAYSELVDPVEQRRRLTRQSLLAADGDPEAMELDEDFLTALEYAMPPTGGLGIGVDRVVMLVMGRSIRETLPFPLVRKR